MTKTYQGSCLCGGVEYELREPHYMTVCHCTRCQRWSGQSLAGVVTTLDNYSITKGAKLVKRFTPGGGFVPRNFCSDCGSLLSATSDTFCFVVAGGMLELDMAPAFHMFAAYKAPWETIGDGKPQYDDGPPPDATTAPSAAR